MDNYDVYKHPEYLRVRALADSYLQELTHHNQAVKALGIAEALRAHRKEFGLERPISRDWLMAYGESLLSQDSEKKS